MAQEIDYKQVLCYLVDDGFVTLDQAKEAVKKYKALNKGVVRSQSWIKASELLKHLQKAMVANNRKPCRTNESAISCIEKMLRIDKLTVEQITSMIDWSQGHDFWSTVVLSPEKLRKNYEQMNAQRARDTKVVPVIVNRQPNRDWKKELERRKEESIPMPADFKSVLRRSAK
jgi:hypothetical protein